MPSIEEAFSRYSQNEKRPISNLVNEGQYFLDNSTNKNFILKPKPGNDVNGNMSVNNNVYRELSMLRRSYSNSKLNNENWRRTLTSQRPHENQHQNWPSQIMSQHQLELFLANRNQKQQQLQHHQQRQYPQSKMHSFQVLRSEGMLQTGGGPLNQSRIITTGNSRMIQSLRDESLNSIEFELSLYRVVDK